MNVGHLFYTKFFCILQIELTVGRQLMQLPAFHNRRNYCGWIQNGEMALSTLDMVNAPVKFKKHISNHVGMYYPDI